jgi:hypothetical protein
MNHGKSSIAAGLLITLKPTEIKESSIGELK